jgi:hypothetical protein
MYNPTVAGSAGYARNRCCSHHREKSAQSLLYARKVFRDVAMPTYFWAAATTGPSVPPGGGTTGREVSESIVLL